MSNIELELLISLPQMLVVAWGFTRVLPMRHAPLFVVLYVGVSVFLNVAGELFFDAATGTVLLLLVEFALPFALYRGSLALRAVAVVAANLCDNVATFVSLAVFSLLMRTPVPDGMDPYYDAIRAHPAAFAVSQVVHIALVIGMFLLLAALVRGRTGKMPAHPGIVFAFLFTQVSLLLELLVVSVMGELSAPLAIAFCLLFVGCLAADAFLLGSMQRYERGRFEQLRTEMLEARLRTSLESYREVVDEIERVGRVRHDMRSQLQVVESLADGGSAERARLLVADMRRQLVVGAGTGALETLEATAGPAAPDVLVVPAVPQGCEGVLP